MSISTVTYHGVNNELKLVETVKKAADDTVGKTRNTVGKDS